MEFLYSVNFNKNIRNSLKININQLIDHVLQNLMTSGTFLLDHVDKIILDHRIFEILVNNFFADYISIDFSFYWHMYKNYEKYKTRNERLGLKYININGVEKYIKERLADKKLSDTGLVYLCVLLEEIIKSIRNDRKILQAKIFY